MKKSLLAIGMALLMAAPLSATEMNFHYNTTDELVSTGTGKNEEYNAAIRLLGTSFKKSEINSFQYQLNGVEKLCDIQGWIRVSLSADPVVTVDPKIDNETGIVTFTLPEAYTITAQGAYVGITFNIDKLDDETKYPLMASYETVANSCFLNTKYLGGSWQQYSGFCLAAEVNVVGDFPENAVEIVKNQKFYLSENQKGSADVIFINKGANNVQSVGYSYELNGETVSGVAQLPSDVMVNYTARSTFQIETPAVPVGSYDINLNVTSVNGEEVEGISMNVALTVAAFIPTRHPVMEEYTGLACGYCPRGFAAVEKVNDEYGDKYIAYAYHYGYYASSDPMALKTAPNSPSGFPAAYYNRVVDADPYYGNGSNAYGCLDLFEELAATFTPASVAVSSSWADDSQEVINVTATASFAEALSDETRIGLVLVEDGLFFEKCAQSNYYANASGFDDDPYMAPFINGGSSVKDLTWNNIAVYLPNTRGYENSLPEAVSPSVPYEFSTTIALADAINTKGASLIQDKSKLSIVAMVINVKTGEILNAIRVPVGQSGATDVAEDWRIDLPTATDELTEIKVEFPAYESVELGNVNAKLVLWQTNSRSGNEIVLNAAVVADATVPTVVLTPAEEVGAGIYNLVIAEGSFKLTSSEGEVVDSPEITGTTEVKTSGIESVVGNAETSDIYSLDGVRILSGANASDIETLPAGLYIVNGKKVIKK